MENMGEKCDMIWKIWEKSVKWYGKYGRKVSWLMKWFGKYGKVSWKVKRFGKCGRKVGWIVKWYGKYWRKESWKVKRYIEDMEESQVE